MASRIILFSVLFASFENISCGTTCTSVPLKNHTAYTSGNQLANITFDLPHGLGPQTCCSIANGWAHLRTKNLTKGLPWTVTVLGPSKTRPGQSSLLCELYDYGAQSSTKPTATSGVTPPLPPLPPAPRPCASFSNRSLCPEGRCFWSDGKGVPPVGSAPVGCADKPPIPCGNNNPGGADNAPLCVHIRVNDSDVGHITGGHFFNVTLNQNATVLSPPPPQFLTDAWYSLADGEFSKPTPHLSKFELCAQYELVVRGRTGENAVAVCVSLHGSFDLQVVTTKGLTYSGRWYNDPFVADVTIGIAP